MSGWLLSYLMQDSFAALLQTPTSQRYKRMRSELLATTSLLEFSQSLAELEAMLHQPEGDLSAAGALVDELKPAGKLSLKWHRLAGGLALHMRDANRAELHKFAYDALRQAILATGRGTQKRPYFITFPSDAHELIFASGQSVKSQSLVEVQERRFDVLLCEDEREYWFDMTELVPITATAVVRPRTPRAASTTPARRKKAVT